MKERRGKKLCIQHDAVFVMVKKFGDSEGSCKLSDMQTTEDVTGVGNLSCIPVNPRKRVLSLKEGYS